MLGGQRYCVSRSRASASVDLDEREVRALAGVAAAGAAAAKQHADVHVGAGGEPGDRPRGEVGTGGRREGLAHSAVRGRGADLDQASGWTRAGEDAQVAVEVASVVAHRSARSSMIRWPAGDRLAPRTAVIAVVGAGEHGDERASLLL